MKRFIVFRKGKFSYIYEKRSVLIVVFALILSIVSILLSTSIGQKYIPILKVIEVLLGNSQGGDSLIINTIRLPRTLVAFLVGASLGISGAILQGVVKNPLADPNIIGITASGSVGALVFLTLFTDSKNNSLTISIFYMPVFAFAGALLSVLLIYFLAYKKELHPIG